MENMWYWRAGVASQGGSGRRENERYTRDQVKGTEIWQSDS